MKPLHAITLAALLSGATGYAALALTAQPAAAQAGSNLDGTYHRNAASAASEDATRANAIAQGVASIPASIRDMWRSQLEELARPMPRVEVRRDATDLVVENGDRVELRSAASGEVEEVEGGWELDQRITNGVLVQHIEGGETLGGDLRQTLRYSVSANNQTLTVETRFEGGELPAAITFRTTYRRQ